jgi:CDP-diglyceride synthetase
MPSKAIRILKRTLSGTLLAGGAALTLWSTAKSDDGRPLFYVSAAVLIAAVLEASRMGALRERDLKPVLSLSAAGVLLLGFAAIAGRRWALEEREVLGALPQASSGVYGPNLLVEYAWPGLIAAAAFSLMHVARRVFRLPDVPTRLIVYGGLGAVLILVVSESTEVLPRLRLGAAVLFVVVATHVPLVLAHGRGRDLAIAAGLALWIVPPLPGLWALWAQWGSAVLVAVVLLSKIGDTVGYYVGSAIGRTHPFPAISPGKTTAGCVASLAGATVVGGVLVHLGFLPQRPLGLAGGLLAGAAINLASQGGDLFESWVKRRAGVKDSSSAFGPSGGVLDQIDSLLFSVPVATLTLPWIFE